MVSLSNMIIAKSAIKGNSMKNRDEDVMSGFKKMADELDKDMKYTDEVYPFIGLSAQMDEYFSNKEEPHIYSPEFLRQT